MVSGLVCTQYLTPVVQAAKIMDFVFKSAYDTLGEGTRGCDLAAEIMAAQVRGTEGNGGTFTAIAPILAVGCDSDAGHMQWDDQPYIVRDEDGCLPVSKNGNGAAVVMELASARNHYHCPMARTVFLGEPSADYKKFVDTCYDAMEVAPLLCAPACMTLD